MATPENIPIPKAIPVYTPPLEGMEEKKTNRAKPNPLDIGPKGNIATDFLQGLGKGFVQSNIGGKFGAAAAAGEKFLNMSPTKEIYKTIARTAMPFGNPLTTRMMGPNVPSPMELLKPENIRKISPLDKSTATMQEMLGTQISKTNREMFNKMMEAGEKIQPTDPTIEGTWRYPLRRLSRNVGKATPPLVEAAIWYYLTGKVFPGSMTTPINLGPTSLPIGLGKMAQSGPMGKAILGTMNALSGIEVNLPAIVSSATFMPLELSGSYESQVANGVDPDEAFDRALGVATIVSSLEIIPASDWVLKLKGARWYKRALRQAKEEMAEEFVQTLAENAGNMEAYKGYDNFAKDLLEGTVDAITTAAVLGGIGGLVSPVSLDDLKADAMGQFQRYAKDLEKKHKIDRKQYDAYMDWAENQITVNMEKAYRSFDTAVKEASAEQAGMAPMMEINVGGQQLGSRVNQFYTLNKDVAAVVKEIARNEYNKYVTRKGTKDKRTMVKFDQLPSQFQDFIRHHTTQMHKLNLRGEQLSGEFSAVMDMFNDDQGVIWVHALSTSRRSTDTNASAQERSDAESPADTLFYLPELQREVSIDELAAHLASKEDISLNRVSVVTNFLKEQAKSNEKFGWSEVIANQIWQRVRKLTNDWSFRKEMDDPVQQTIDHMYGELIRLYSEERATTDPKELKKIEKEIKRLRSSLVRIKKSGGLERVIPKRKPKPKQAQAKESPAHKLFGTTGTEVLDLEYRLKDYGIYIEPGTRFVFGDAEFEVISVDKPSNQIQYALVGKDGRMTQAATAKYDDFLKKTLAKRILTEHHKVELYENELERLKEIKRKISEVKNKKKISALEKQVASGLQIFENESQVKDLLDKKIAFLEDELKQMKMEDRETVSDEGELVTDSSKTAAKRVWNPAKKKWEWVQAKFTVEELGRRQRSLQSHAPTVDRFSEDVFVDQYNANKKDGKKIDITVSPEELAKASKIAKQNGQKIPGTNWKQDSIEQTFALRERLASLSQALLFAKDILHVYTKSSIKQAQYAQQKQIDKILKNKAMNPQEKDAAILRAKEPLRDLLTNKGRIQKANAEQFQIWLDENKDVVKFLEDVFNFSFDGVLRNTKTIGAFLKKLEVLRSALNKVTDAIKRDAAIKSQSQKKPHPISAIEQEASNMGEYTDSQEEEQPGDNIEDAQGEIEDKQFNPFEKLTDYEKEILGVGLPRYGVDGNILSGKASGKKLVRSIAEKMADQDIVTGSIDYDIDLFDSAGNQHNLKSGDFLEIHLRNPGERTIKVNSINRETGARGDDIVLSHEQFISLLHTGSIHTREYLGHATPEELGGLPEDAQQAIEKNKIDFSFNRTGRRKAPLRLFLALWKLLRYPARLVSIVKPTQFDPKTGKPLPAFDEKFTEKGGLGWIRDTFYGDDKAAFRRAVQKEADITRLPEYGETIDLLMDGKILMDIAPTLGYISVEGLVKRANEMVTQHIPNIAAIISQEKRFLNKRGFTFNQKNLNKEIELTARKRILKLASAISSSAFNEIGAGAADVDAKNMKFFITILGLGGQMQNTVYANKPGLRKNHEQLSTIERYTELAGELVKYGLMTSAEYNATMAQLKNNVRPQLLFFSLLKHIDPGFQNSLVWAKGNLETPLLLESLKRGVWSGADMVSNVMRGYMFRFWKEKDARTYSSYMPSGFGNVYTPQAEYFTYEEFVASAKDAKLVVIDDFYTSMSKYISDNLVRLSTKNTVDVLKNIRNPRNPNYPIIAYTKDAFLQNVGGDNPQAQLTNLGYVRMKNMNALTDWHKGIFYDPWIHKSLAGVLNEVYSTKRGSNSLLDAVIEIQNATKRFLVSNPIDSAFLNVGGAFVTLPAEQIIDDIIMPAASALTPKGVKNWFKAAGQINEGQYYKLDQLNAYTKQGRKINIVKAMKAGLVFNLGEVAQSLFERRAFTTFPGLKDAGDRIRDNYDSALGGNAILYDRFLKNISLKTWDFLYQQNLQKGMDDRQAARRAASYVNNISMMLNPAIFGKNSRLYMMGLFTRNIATSVIRMMNKATAPIWAGTSNGILKVRWMGQEVALPWYGRTGLHKFRTGATSFLNPITLADESLETLETEWQRYATHIGKLAFAATLFNGIIQFALSYMDDDEYDEQGEKGSERGIFAKKRYIWNNENGKLWMIRSPFKDVNNKRIYLDTQFLKEVKHMSDIWLGSISRRFGQGGLTWGRRRLHMVFQWMFELANNKDAFTGDEIVPQALRDSEHWTKYYTTYFERWLKDYGIPLGLRPDEMAHTNNPALNKALGMAQFGGVALRRGVPLESSGGIVNWKNYQTLEDEAAISKYESRQDSDKYKDLTNEQLLEEVKAGRLAPDAAMRRIKRRAAPFQTIATGEGQLKKLFERKIKLQNEGKPKPIKIKPPSFKIK